MLYLIRHAAVERRADLPAREWALSKNGVQQAARLGARPEWHALTKVISSPERKARATAEPIARGARLRVIVEHDLREVERPPVFAASDEYRAAVARLFAGDPEEGWEPMDVALMRIRDVVEAHHPTSEGPIALVSHGLLLTIYSAWLNACEHPSLDEWSALPMPALALADPDRRRIIEAFAAAT